MLIVDDDPERVEADLLAGNIHCPACGGTLGPWWFARPRKLRDVAGSVVLRPRRARCPKCRVTHVLLSNVALLRRVDTAAVIGRGLSAAARGLGHRKVAADLDRPESTVRGWMRRARTAAGRIESHFVAWAHATDPNLGPISPVGFALANAVEAIGVAARAASLRLGPRPAWAWASVMSGGGLLCNTNSPWPAPRE